MAAKAQQRIAVSTGQFPTLGKVQKKNSLKRSLEVLSPSVWALAWFISETNLAFCAWNRFQYRSSTALFPPEQVLWLLHLLERGCSSHPLEVLGIYECTWSFQDHPMNRSLPVK